MSQTKAQLVSGTTAQDLIVDNINTTSVNGGQLGNRRININGEQTISQRGTSFSFAHDGTTAGYTTDRYYLHTTSTDEFDCTVSQDSTVPDGQGFSKSLKLLTGTAEGGVGSGERIEFQHMLEGQDLQSLAYGSSAAKKIVISFWVRSSVTGTFGFSIYRNESAGGRIVNKPYTISSANTWEKKTLSIDGDTVRAITNDNASRARLVWPLLAGTDFTSGGSQSSYTAYASGSYSGGHAQNGVGTTAGATWYITGVQLEVNSSGVATDFEHRSFGQELALCQRYYYQNTSYGTVAQTNSGETVNTSGFGGITMYSTTSGRSPFIYHPVSMRATPTVTFFSASNAAGGADNKLSVYSGGTGWDNVNTNTAEGTTVHMGFKITTNDSFTAGDTLLMGGQFSCSAEL